MENFKSNISLQYQMTIQGHTVTLHAFQIELQLVLFATYGTRGLIRDTLGRLGGRVEACHDMVL